MTKVSVIVPTYKPGDRLDRVIASLDAQTLPQDQFESIFVDDGSPDDTFERLKRLAESRPNMRVTSIPNSGWPSRPRNVGLDMARGEYVVFMDHDDEIYPRGLEAGYEVGRTNEADVVNGKETRTSEWFAYWGAFQEDVSLPAKKRPRNLSPWTTHKLFRREFLLETGIRFREGARMLWEDVMVDIDVYSATDRIAVMASVPFYKWVHSPGENYSLTYGRDLDEFLASIGMMFDYVTENAADPGFVDFMKGHQYGNRILTYMLGPRSLRRTDEEFEHVLRIVPEFVERHVPIELDARQTPVNRARAHLLRTGRLHLVRPLAEADNGVKVLADSDVRWTPEGSLEVTFEGTWVGADGRPLLFRREGDRILRHLPDDVAGALPQDLVDVTEELAKTHVDLALTSRADHVGWPVRATHETVVTDLDGGLATVGFKGSAVVNPRSGVFGQELGDDVWTVTLRAGFLGFLSHHPLPYDGRSRVAALPGRFAVAFGTKAGKLALDLGGGQRHVLDETAPAAKQAQIVRAGLWSSKITVPMRGVEVALGARRACELRLRRIDDGQELLLFPGEIVADADGARVEGVVRLPRGRYRIAIRDQAVPAIWGTRLVATSGRSRRVTLSVRPGVPRAKRWWGQRRARRQAEGSSESR
ncbi:MAG TPA: glycosyltransferase [Nocardioidaceae bacterium]|nr:glycosyltransferase [Nocardioidaceae bacterium]